MMEIITFEIPGDAVPKGRPRFGRGKAYTPDRTRDYEAKVKRMAKHHAPGEPLRGPLEARLVFYRPIPKNFTQKQRQDIEGGLLRPIKKTGDLDNLAKSILDPMNGVIFGDDSQVVTLIAEKYYSDEPRVYVEILEM